MGAYRKEEYWSRFASTFDEDQTYVAGSDVQQAIIDRLSEERDLGELIEFGCGAGLFTKALAANADHVTATDLSDEMLAAARTQLASLPNVTLQKADCEQTAFPDKNFGSVFMANLIHVVENPSRVLRESYRILDEGGLLLVVTYTSFEMKLLDKIGMAIRFIRRFGKPLGHFRGNLSPDELRSLAENAGFQVETVQIVGDRNKALYLKAKKR
jgi:ABC-2 type transport system ATP-binding protein